MPPPFFAGIWIFDPDASQLNSPPPLRWVQHVTVDGDRIRVREEIRRATETKILEVEALPDGMFYPVTGSPIVDEISYVFEGTTIRGLARKDGSVSFKETLDFSDTGAMTMFMTLVRSGEEIPLGMARFKRAEDPAE